LLQIQIDNQHDQGEKQPWATYGGNILQISALPVLSRRASNAPVWLQFRPDTEVAVEGQPNLRLRSAKAVKEKQAARQ
jgi:hypothetical protein